MSRPLIGSILERKPTAPPSAPSSASTSSGFPAVQHRSQSAFSRARREGSWRRPHTVPTIQTSSRAPVEESERVPPPADPDGWRAQAEEENRRRVQAMSEEELEQERAEILEKFGPNVADVLKKARDARLKARGEDRNDAPPHVPPVTSPKRAGPVTSILRPASPDNALPGGGSRPPSRADRKIRFADVTPNDVHVYESAPSSPKRKALALPPPTENDGPTISLGTWNSAKGRAIALPSPSAPDPATVDVSMSDADEGTPEDIRRRFFPTAPAQDPSLEWIRLEPVSAPSEDHADLRFDLSGNPIPANLAATLPTHLGLHHHAEGSHAGYTLEDIFLLSRSTVPAQRASMLGILSRIADRLARGRAGDAAATITELAGQEAPLRKRMLATGIEAMAERSSVGARAIELIWECLVRWDGDLADIENVELKDLDVPPAPSQSSGVISSLPLNFILPQISTALGLGALPRESLTQLLAIVHRISQHSNETASAIIGTQSLIANLVQTFLLTPIPPTDESPPPNPFALRVLRGLALSTRENAAALVGPADALLRFVIALPPDSPYPLALSIQLLAETLEFFTALASYGLYSHVATTAQEYFIKLGDYVRSDQCQSQQLKVSWLRVLEAWMVCARDPHCTTPPHDILWSQVSGWDWGREALAIRTSLSESDEDCWAAIWRAGAAFLEGARVNGVQSGEGERVAVLDLIQDGFAGAVEKRVLENALEATRTALEELGAVAGGGIRREHVPILKKAARHASTLAASIRLWLCCLQPSTHGPPEAPPFSLPFAGLSELCATLTSHQLWSALYLPNTTPYAHTLCRPLSTLLAAYLRLSRRIPGTIPDLWIAQALAISLRILPGDEDFALRTISELIDILSPDFVGARAGKPTPAEIWEKGGFEVIKPFLTHFLRSTTDLYVGPLWSTPSSISHATTQRLPPLSILVPNGRRGLALPLTADWMFTPLDNLLRSGDSEAFKHLPSSWNASEVDIVRATLLLARISQDVLRSQGLAAFAMSREELVFGCMKVFMLEHGQQQNDSSEEVFRDSVASTLMADLLAPYSAGASPQTLATPPPPADDAASLEVVARRFLGGSTPFYQYYTDFVGLYDSVSFGDALFGRLLLPPLSMRYPPDYRKHLWADYSHVMRTVRTAPDAVLTGGIADYLWPAESDPEIVGAYVRALVRGPLSGFVRLVAIHHIACGIWSDLGADGGEKGAKILRAIVDQGSFDVVREVVLYRQETVGTILLPPACFEQVGDWRGSRRDFVARCGGDLEERLKNLLEA